MCPPLSLSTEEWISHASLFMIKGMFSSITLTSNSKNYCDGLQNNFELSIMLRAQVQLINKSKSQTVVEKCKFRWFLQLNYMKFSHPISPRNGSQKNNKIIEWSCNWCCRSCQAPLTFFLILLVWNLPCKSLDIYLW